MEHSNLIQMGGGRLLIMKMFFLLFSFKDGSVSINKYVNMYTNLYIDIDITHMT